MPVDFDPVYDAHVRGLIDSFNRGFGTAALYEEGEVRMTQNDLDTIIERVELILDTTMPEWMAPTLFGRPIRIIGTYCRHDPEDTITIDDTQVCSSCNTATALWDGRSWIPTTTRTA